MPPTGGYEAPRMWQRTVHSALCVNRHYSRRGRRSKPNRRKTLPPAPADQRQSAAVREPASAARRDAA